VSKSAGRNASEARAGLEKQVRGRRPVFRSGKASAAREFPAWGSTHENRNSTEPVRRGNERGMRRRATVAGEDARRRSGVRPQRHRQGWRPAGPRRGL